jgi:hypothetical protein
MTLVRALWSIVVVCLVAATGVQPVRAAGSDRPEDSARRCDQHAALLAVTATQPAARVAPRTARPRPRLPVFVLTTAPEAPRLTARMIAGTARDGRDQGSALVPIRSARGPPAR